MIDYISPYMENIHENVDPAYKMEKEEAKRQLQPIGLVATATLIASIALGIFGIALAVSGGYGAIVALPLILISVPLCYLSYNAYKVTKNIDEIIDNPKKYQKFHYQQDPTLDMQKIKKKLAKDTICFRPVVDWFVDKMDR